MERCRSCFTSVGAGGASTRVVHARASSVVSRRHGRGVLAGLRSRAKSCGLLERHAFRRTDVLLSIGICSYAWLLCSSGGSVAIGMLLLAALAVASYTIAGRFSPPASKISRIGHVARG